jgi:hypothetical protein
MKSPQALVTYRENLSRNRASLYQAPVTAFDLGRCGRTVRLLHPLVTAAAATGAVILEHKAARFATLLGEVCRFDLGNWMRADRCRAAAAGFGHETNT